MSWSRAFDDPIRLSNGCELVTLRDAGECTSGRHRAKRTEADLKAWRDQRDWTDAMLNLSRY